MNKSLGKDNDLEFLEKKNEEKENETNRTATNGEVSAADHDYNKAVSIPAKAKKWTDLKCIEDEEDLDSTCGDLEEKENSTQPEENYPKSYLEVAQIRAELGTLHECTENEDTDTELDKLADDSNTHKKTCDLEIMNGEELITEPKDCAKASSLTSPFVYRNARCDTRESREASEKLIVSNDKPSLPSLEKDDEDENLEVATQLTLPQTMYASPLKINDRANLKHDADVIEISDDSDAELSFSNNIKAKSHLQVTAVDGISSQQTSRGRVIEVLKKTVTVNGEDRWLVKWSNATQPSWEPYVVLEKEPIFTVYSNSSFEKRKSRFVGCYWNKKVRRWWGHVHYKGQQKYVGSSSIESKVAQMLKDFVQEYKKKGIKISDRYGSLREGGTKKHASHHVYKRKKSPCKDEESKIGKIICKNDIAFSAAHNGNCQICHNRTDASGNDVNVACRTCSGWFHPSCANWTLNSSKRNYKFMCEGCTSQKSTRKTQPTRTRAAKKRKRKSNHSSNIPSFEFQWVQPPQKRRRPVPKHSATGKPPVSKPMNTMTIIHQQAPLMRMHLFVRGIGSNVLAYQNAADILLRNQLCWNTLRALDVEDLVELGISKPHAKFILHEHKRV